MTITRLDTFKHYKLHLHVSSNPYKTYVKGGRRMKKTGKMKSFEAGGAVLQRVCVSKRY